MPNWPSPQARALACLSVLGLMVACVPSQRHIESDAPLGRWVQSIDTSPGRLDLNYIAVNQPYHPGPVRRASLGTLARVLDAHPGPSGLIEIDPYHVPLRLQADMRLGANGPRKFLAQGWTDFKPPLSPGDRLRIVVYQGEEFSGVYELDMDGTLNLPYLPPLQLAGRDVFAARQLIRDALVNAGYFRAELLAINVVVQQWAPVQVSISGAVFVPGQVTINVRKPEDRALKAAQESGDFPPERFLPAALRSAGGLRPDANPEQIVVIRQGQKRLIDVSGYLSGLATTPFALMSGDAIVVPSTGRFDESLVRPSSVTAPGIRVFMSNLTVPATDNSKSAINQLSTGLPYGTRLLSGLVSANCVGGTGATNSARYAVLVTRNPLSGETEVIERSIEDLMRAPHLEYENPYLMPNDGIACYDSGVTNLRDIGKTIADIISPFR